MSLGDRKRNGKIPEKTNVIDVVNHKNGNGSDMWPGYLKTSEPNEWCQTTKTTDQMYGSHHRPCRHELHPKSPGPFNTMKIREGLCPGVCDCVEINITQHFASMSSSEKGNIVPQSSTCEDSLNSRKRSRIDTVAMNLDNHDENVEDGMQCPVCLDAWTSSGVHRLCSLKCGHLFGLSCVDKWLGQRNRTCPSCNASAKKKDIREIYATRLIVLDTTDMDRLRHENNQIKMEIKKLKEEVNVQKALVQYFQENSNPSSEKEFLVPISNSPPFIRPMKSRIQYLFALEEGTCRVLVYNERKGELIVSQQNLSLLWQGFGIRKVLNDFQNWNPLIPTHKQEIRDMAYCPFNDDLLLIVSLDKTAKVYDLSSNKMIFNWSCDHRLWSCSWDPEESSIAYVGTEKGCVFRLDIDNNSSPLQLPFPKETKPVAVVSLISSLKLGCILCCRLMSLMVYFKRNNNLTTVPLKFEEQLLFEGRFAAMALSNDGVLVLTTRPTNEHPQVRHLCYQLEVIDNRMEFKGVQVFPGGNQSTLLSRTSLLRTPVGLLFFAFDESASMIFGWCVGQNAKIASISCESSWRDILAIYRDNEVILLTLNDHVFRGIALN